MNSDGAADEYCKLFNYGNPEQNIVVVQCVKVCASGVLKREECGQLPASKEKYCKAVKYFIITYEFFVGGEILILQSGFSRLHLWAILALINQTIN